MDIRGIMIIIWFNGVSKINLIQFILLYNLYDCSNVCSKSVHKSEIYGYMYQSKATSTVKLTNTVGTVTIAALTICGGCEGCGQRGIIIRTWF